MTRIAIIGCGIVGAAIAYELSRVNGLTITLIDQGMPASGSTRAALGVLMGVISYKTKGRAWQLRQASLKRYETLIPELEALTGYSIPYNRHGILMLQHEYEEKGQWENLVAIRRSQGWHLELWERSYLLSRCPQLQNPNLVGAIYSPHDRQVHPTLLTQALISGAALNGVNCCFGVKVESIVALPEGSLQHCYQVQTSEETIEFDWLVVSAGLGTTPLTEVLGQPTEIRPVLGQALQLRLDQPLGDPEFQPVITGNDVHIVPLSNQEYWIGATVEFPDEQGAIMAQPTLLEQVRQEAITFCPALANAEIVHSWSGKRPRPEGQPAPLIGRLPGYNNILLATGHYRNGVLLAPGTAQIIRETIHNYTAPLHPSESLPAFPSKPGCTMRTSTFCPGQS